MPEQTPDQTAFELENADLIVTLWAIDGSLERMKVILESMNEQLKKSEE